LGKIQVVGLTLNETQNKIKGLAKLYLTEAFVRVGIGGIRFSIIGDVNRPGKYMVLQNRLTILEAISTAGDLSVSGNRRRVQLIRQYPEGSRIVHLDLTKRDFLSSPYFFLKPNDVIYVPPLRVRELGNQSE
jgi:polysaccharide export outer membrane protein